MRVVVALAPMVFVLLGCSPNVLSGDGTGDTGTDTGGCLVGQVACECTAGGGCDPGLQCIVGVCIPDEVDTSVTTSSPATGESSASESDSSPPDTSATENSTSPETETETAETSSTGESSSEGPPSPCGNGRLEDGEICDDGNTVTGDGCNADCLPGGQEIWTVILDGESLRRDEPHRVAIDADDDIYVAGNSWKVALNDSDAYLIKLDDDGQLQWTDRQDSGVFESNDGCWGVAVLADQSVVTTGWRYTDAFTREGVVRAYSEDGDVLWTHYETDNGDAFAYDVDVDSMGDIVVTGAVSDPMDGQPRTWLAKFTPDGDIVWEYRIQVPSFTGTIALALDSNDAIAIGAANTNAYVQKRDDDAQEIWTYSDVIVGAYFLGIATAPDDGVFVAGSAGNSTYAAHHPADGVDPDWSETWPGSFGGGAYFNAVAVDGAGRTIWVGHENGGGHVYLFARKLDTDGEEVWVHEIMGSDVGSDTAFGVAVDSLDQPVVVARHRSEDSEDDFWIRKLTP